MEYRGVVQHGTQEAGASGVPTINISFSDASLSGIYAGTVRTEKGEYRAAIYANQRRKVLEAHLFDFSADLYGKEVRIELLEKIRDDVVFADKESLHAAIQNDIIAIRAYFTP